MKTERLFILPWHSRKMLDREGLDNLERLLNLTARVIDSLAGVKPEDSRFVESQALAEKILLHALTIRLLLNQPVTLPLNAPGITRYDFSSAIVLARSVFETYLTLHKVFLAPTTADEFEFQYSLWRIKGLIALQNFEPHTGPGAGNYSGLMATLDECRKSIKSTNRFKALTTKQQCVAIEKGEDKSQVSRDYTGAGFDTITFSRLFGYTSSYVHADGHAALQIRTAQTHEDQQGLFGLALTITQVVLAKVSLELAKRYTECDAACKANQASTELAFTYSKVAVLLGDPKARQQAIDLPP